MQTYRLQVEPGPFVPWVNREMLLSLLEGGTLPQGNLTLGLTLVLPGDEQVRFLLWLPAGVANATTPWPVVFFLHGAFRGYPEPLPRVANHGLPHRIETNHAFNQRFVLVSPQVTYTGTNAKTLQSHVPSIIRRR